jgi:hypothetical protein
VISYLNFFKFFFSFKKIVNFEKNCKISIFSKLQENLKNFEPKKSNLYVELDELIIKIHTLLGFELAFHKIIEENWIKF